ncbi:MAG: bifunctional [glutamate--ammonia ligase]-adenylyl-L-tyrosine phosphorylase/[glutamate--ammonia-ligase] adenylyltransferase, partial [Xanthomonadales bacterium]|nr:bifunctional [glutamate--ammonia ligase]-adenylyl-L-tyrosine phosphorylase/[glutamate--ammonia-ligase] adenylyltransferase [Xanthomonadales bacterium]
DVVRGASVDRVMAATSRVAERGLAAALACAGQELEQRHGLPRNAAGEIQPLACIAMGKLGGAELNFSSDIDLIFAFPEGGESDGPRALDNEDYFARQVQRATTLLSEVNEHGYCFRVDLRLRPFGSAGRLALSFDAMEQYYQREGRDWERFAWIRARPLMPAVAAGGDLLSRLQPFVYRRYLDFAAFDGLRELKARMDQEVIRREWVDDLKRGPGGIRELEFLVQLPQLIRGGRLPDLRLTGILPALACQLRHGLIGRAEAQWLASAYRFLRLVENRVQMLDDQQTHRLPTEALKRERLAIGLGFADWPALLAEIDGLRERISQAYGAVLGPVSQPQPRSAAADAPGLWEQAQALEGDSAVGALAVLRHFQSIPAVQMMSARGRARLDRVMPLVLSAIQAHSEASGCNAETMLQRWLSVLNAILRRTSYLALLTERPGLVEEATRLLGQSAWMAQLLAAAPVLLDELLDARRRNSVPRREDYESLLRAELDHVERDLEQQVEVLRRLQQGEMLRLAYGFLEGHLDAVSTAASLADLADVLLTEALDVALSEMQRQFGCLPGTSVERPGMVVIGYGSLGGRELNFASDLDLVCLYDEALVGAESDGPRQLDHHRYFVRTVQRLVHLLTAQTPLGPLYEIDMRLRPNGSKGLLIVGHEAFERYQRSEAWTWEQQALVRARAVAGDRRMAARFERIRGEILAQRRVAADLANEVGSMRTRMRAELDRSDAEHFDLKQGDGGLVDIEFELQQGVLQLAADCPRRPRWPTATPALIERLLELGGLDSQRAEWLSRRHRWLLGEGMRCTLALQPRLVPADRLLRL